MLFTIDCGALDRKGFHALLNDTDSPLFRKGHVFYFREVNRLPASWLQELVPLLTSGLSDGNQLLFSVRENADDTWQNAETSVHALLTAAPSPVLRLPPLRRRMYELPSLVSLYLNELNNHGTHQLAGVEPEGMAYLQSYAWPGNIRQFCKVLDALAQVTSTPYITVSAILDILEAEPAPRVNGPGSAALNLDRPLNEIISDIVHIVLSREGMTQAKASRQLGICRTTLWKYLKTTSPLPAPPQKRK